MGIYVKFYHDHSPNMVMSRDPGYKFRNFYFSPNSILNFRKSYHIWEKLAQEQESFRQQTKLEVENTPPPPPPPPASTCRVKYVGQSEVGTKPTKSCTDLQKIYKTNIRLLSSFHSLHHSSCSRHTHQKETDTNILGICGGAPLSQIQCLGERPPAVPSIVLLHKLYCSCKSIAIY